MWRNQLGACRHKFDGSSAPPRSHSCRLGMQLGSAEWGQCGEGVHSWLTFSRQTCDHVKLLLWHKNKIDEQKTRLSQDICLLLWSHKKCLCRLIPMTEWDGHAFTIIYGRRLMAQSERTPVSCLGLHSWREIAAEETAGNFATVMSDKKRKKEEEAKKQSKTKKGVVSMFIFPVLEK